MNLADKSKSRVLAFNNNYPKIEYPGPDFLKDTFTNHKLMFAAQ
jgi:hypothetical protein